MSNIYRFAVQNFCSEKNNGPQYEQRQYSTMDAGICTSSCYSVAPAGCCPTYFFYLPARRLHCDGQTDRLIVSGANVSSFHWQLNAYRSRCKVKVVHSKDRLAALVKDSPAPLTLRRLLYAFNLAADSSTCQGYDLS